VDAGRGVLPLLQGQVWDGGAAARQGYSCIGAGSMDFTHWLYPSCHLLLLPVFAAPGLREAVGHFKPNRGREGWGRVHFPVRGDNVPPPQPPHPHRRRLTPPPPPPTGRCSTGGHDGALNTFRTTLHATRAAGDLNRLFSFMNMARIICVLKLACWTLFDITHIFRDIAYSIVAKPFELSCMRFKRAIALQTGWATDLRGLATACRALKRLRTRLGLPVWRFIFIRSWDILPNDGKQAAHRASAHF